MDCDAYFESAAADPECPNCAGIEPERAFLTPPAIRSGATSVKDEMVKGLAADFGLSNLNSNKHGEAVARRPSPPPEAAPQFMGPEAVRRMKIPENARDGFSSVLPAIQQMGGPTTWMRKQGK